MDNEDIITKQHQQIENLNIRLQSQQQEIKELIKKNDELQARLDVMLPFGMGVDAVNEMVTELLNGREAIKELSRIREGVKETLAYLDSYPLDTVHAKRKLNNLIGEKK